MTRLFHKQGFPRGRRKIPQDGEVGFCTYNCCAEAQTIFPGPHNRSSDGPTFEKSSPEAAGRMALWAIELSEFDVQYHPRTAVKGQIVADFIAEYTQSKDKGSEGHKLWSIHTDGSSNQRSGGAGVVIQTPEGG